MTTLFEKIKLIREYTNHNKKIFSLNTNKKTFFELPKNINNKKQILIEFNAFNDFHVVASVLANFFKKRHKGLINAFFNYSLLSAPLRFSYISNIKWFLGSFLNKNFFFIYRSFGVQKIFKPKISNIIKKKAEKITLAKLVKIKNKIHLLDLQINNVLIGDLLYDTYLKSKKTPTININSNEFKKFFQEFIELYYFWEDYFKNNDVKVIITSHLSYSYAIPLRLANKKKILSLVVTSKSIIRYSKKTFYGYGNFKDYSKKFSRLKINHQKKKLDQANINLKKRFDGQIGLKGDKVLFYSDKSSFNNHKVKKEYIKKNSRTKILICTHDFFDAVHLYGKFIFSDFHDWLNHIGNLSKKTNYDWYIKNHPKVGGKFLISHFDTEQIILDFLKKYPNINLLPDDLSHKYIIKNKIDLVLTVYGTVGIEYPYFKIPVLNAGSNNPHCSFNFNIHPKNIKEFDTTIMNIPKIKNLKKIRKEILSYYYMSYLKPNNNWFFSDYYHMTKSIGGYQSLQTDKIYEYFSKNINGDMVTNIEKNLENFINSNKDVI